MNGSESITRSWVFKLVIINCIIYTFQLFQPQLAVYGALFPNSIASDGMIWQLFTYMFMHGSPMHLMFNMYSLFIFGITVEDIWGSRKFITYYLFCGVGAGIVIFLIGYLKGGMAYYSPTVGASGAIFGLLLAFGVLFPEAEVLLFFLIPMKARTMVVVFGALELYMELGGGFNNISHIGHLGGILFGIIYFAVVDRWRSTRRKMRAVVAKVEKPLLSEKSPVRSIVAGKDEHHELKKNIIAKLEAGGDIHSLSDDEYQFIKYLDIITESGKIEKKRSVNMTDDYISDHKFIEIVKKYISL